MKKEKKRKMWMQANNAWIECRLEGKRWRWQWQWQQRKSEKEIKTPLKQTRHGWFVCLIKYNGSTIRFCALLLAANQWDRVLVFACHSVFSFSYSSIVIDVFVLSLWFRLLYGWCNRYSCGIDNLQTLWPPQQTVRYSTSSSRRFKRDLENAMHLAKI